ncbi:Holliday junction resolvase RuvX [Candidatus Aquiluna sp. UB-MaderosW2red]|uniref:Holliday junction resolvase RuvX n=1 Tax=Candidatus Aquiluna sp. UB-MaderosW2red TaxID=1855377 RepID=UPI000875B387|nr:Holliday junction resolvase RuvX [Candidatus Aquiluna sp. UB-MaderosW2red]SCX11565.1 putative holliday junction resolvase [Candidatus Aquiluna sp. UB-MaderosW2red]
MNRRLALDSGDARIGIAISEGTLVLPIEAIPNDAQAVSKILSEIQARSIAAVYIGLPLSLGGGLSNSAHKAIALGKALASQSQVPVRFVDERLTTKTAASMLRSAGKNAKSSKSIIDAQAAAIILESALQQEVQGQLAGKTLEDLND